MLRKAFLKRSVLKRAMLKRAVLIALSAHLLSACDGGSGGGSGGIQGGGEVPEPGALMTGQFVDSAVTGLYYQTPSQSGFTNENGEFNYVEGESISFHIGGINLGAALAGQQLTPFSLAGIIPYTAESRVVRALSSENVTAFDRAINIACLLQILDRDGQPDNGIDLSDAHERLQGQHFDFSVKATSFEKHLRDSGILENVNSYHQISLIEALEHIYNSLGLEVESSQVSSFSDERPDGENETVSYEYDADGRVSSLNVDLDSDGVADQVQSFEYDGEGNLSRIENSATRKVELMYYNERNQMVGRSISMPMEGNLITEVFEYDGDKLARTEVSSQDNTHVLSYQYNASGNLSSVLVDSNDDGEDDIRSEYAYQNGRVSSFSEDSNNDGSAELKISYAYDNQGNRTEHRIDSDQDGQIDMVNAFSYDSNNHPVRFEQDKDLDGVADYVEDYIYDTAGNRTRYRKDLDADGRWDFVAHYYYDESGKRTKMIEDSDGNGLADKVWSRQYQAAATNNDWSAILEQVN